MQSPGRTTLGLSIRPLPGDEGLMPHCWGWTRGRFPVEPGWREVRSSAWLPEGPGGPILGCIPWPGVHFWPCSLALEMVGIIESLCPTPRRLVLAPAYATRILILFLLTGSIWVLALAFKRWHYFMNI